MCVGSVCTTCSNWQPLGRMRAQQSSRQPAGKLGSAHLCAPLPYLQQWVFNSQTNVGSPKEQAHTSTFPVSHPFLPPCRHCLDADSACYHNPQQKASLQLDHGATGRLRLRMEPYVHLLTSHKLTFSCLLQTQNHVQPQSHGSSKS